MKILVLGASGNTGKHAVEQLLAKGEKVKALVRNPISLNVSWKEHDYVEIVKGNILEMNSEMCQTLLMDCQTFSAARGY